MKDDCYTNFIIIGIRSDKIGSSKLVKAIWKKFPDLKLRDYVLKDFDIDEDNCQDEVIEAALEQHHFGPVDTWHYFGKIIYLNDTDLGDIMGDFSLSLSDLLKHIEEVTDFVKILGPIVNQDDIKMFGGVEVYH